MKKINITLKPGQHIYFTSDSHWGHRNVIRFCNRPFVDEQEMNEKLVEYWNEVVSNDDYIVSCGDLSWWNDRHGIKRLVSKLNGNKLFLLGNHCTEKQYELVPRDNFELCGDIAVLFIRPEDHNDPRFTETKCYEIVCSHYPLTTWSHIEHTGCYNFFGHIHSKKGEPLNEFGGLLKFSHPKYMDVGVDRHDYKPVDLFDVLKEISEYNYTPHME